MEIVIILLVFLLLGLGGMCYWMWKRESKLSSQSVVTEEKEKKYVKVDSSHLLVVTSLESGVTRMIQGGVIEETPGVSYSIMPLSAISWNGVIRAMSSENVSVNIPVTITASVGNTENLRQLAVSKFLSSGENGIRAFLGSISESSVRSIMTGMAISDVLHSDDLRVKAQEKIESGLSAAGLEVLAFSISDLSDDADYIKSLSQREVGKIKTAAQSELMAQQKLDAIQAEKDKTELEVAQNEAELERRMARQDSDAKLREIKKQEAIADAEADREVQVKTAEIRADQNRKIAYAQSGTDQAREEAKIKKDFAISKAKTEATKAQEELEIKSNAELEKSRKIAEIEIEMAELEKSKKIQEAKDAQILAAQKAQAELVLSRTQASKDNALAQEAANQEINEAKKTTELAAVEFNAEISKAKAEKDAELEKLKELQKVEIAKASEKAKEAEINATTILETKKKNEKAELEAKAKKSISKINAEAAAEKSTILAEAEAISIEKKALAQAHGKEADLLAEASKIKALEEIGVESIKSLIEAGLSPEIILQIRTVEQIKSAAEVQSGLLEKLNLSDVTILGDSKTVGDFITQTTTGISPALEKLRSLPLTKATEVIEDK